MQVKLASNLQEKYKENPTIQFSEHGKKSKNFQKAVLKNTPLRMVTTLN